MRNLKNEDTRCEVLGEYSSRIRYSPASIQGAVAQMAPHTILRSPNGNRYTLYLYFNDGKWNWNYNWLDNDRNVNNPSAVLAILFISLLLSQESFVLSVVRSSRRACGRSHPVFPRARYIFYCPAIWFPIRPSTLFSRHPSF